MTDVQFLSNNSVVCEANHVKCEMLMQDSWEYKTSYESLVPILVIYGGRRGIWP